MTRRGRARRQREASVPDWAWGLGLGLVVVIAVGGYFVLTQTGGDGGGGGTCGQALNPLGSSEISQSAFNEEDAALSRVVALLNAGDRAGAESEFFGPVHNFTHNVDPPVRQQDADLAVELCETVVFIEEGFARRDPSGPIANAIQDMQRLIRDSAVALGYDRPG